MRCLKQRQIGQILALLLLTGCSGGAPAPVTAVVHTCPAPVDYSEEAKQEGKRELALAPSHQELDLMLENYSVLQAQARACLTGGSAR